MVRGMTVKKYLMTALMCSASAGLWINPAMANDAQVQPQATTAGGVDPVDASGDIVVTAQRRSEKLSEVPISITAVDDAALRTAGVGTTLSLAKVTPGLVAVNQGFNFSVAIRGISSTGNAAGDETNVALYVDGIYVSSPTAGLFSFNNIERIEVLKGPQGTLFGRNATGGAIRVITKDPSHDPSIDASADYSPNFSARRGQIYATGGLSDTIAADLALYYYEDDGYITNVNPDWTGGKIGRMRSFSARSKVAWEPSSDFKATLILDHSTNKSSSTLSARVANLSATIGAQTGFRSNGRWESSRTFEPVNDVETNGVSLTANWQISPQVRLNSITAYNDAKSDNLLDFDNSYLDITKLIAPYRTKAFSQEVTLTTDLGGMVDFAGGLFYFDARNCSCNVVLVRSPSTFLSDRDQHTSVKSIAGFGEVTIRPLPRVQIIAGARYTDERKHNSGVSRVPVFTADNRDSFSNTSVRLTARYTLNDDDANIYATYSTGFKSGAYGTLEQKTQVTKPEKIKAIEAGVKLPLDGGRMLLTAAIFHYDYTDIQLSSLDVNRAVTSLQNAGKAKVTGAELGLNGKLGSHLTLNSGISWLPRAEYTEYRNAAIVRPNLAGTALENAIVDLSGTRLVRAPKFTFNVGGTYTADIAGGAASLSANYFHSSEVVLAAGERVVQKPYDTLDLRAAFSPNSGPVELSVYATNVTNVYYATGGQTTTSADSYYSARPREIGFGVRARF